MALATEQKLFKMLETLAYINSVTDLERLLQLIMKSIKEVMESEASSLMLLDDETNELYFSSVEGGSDKIMEIRIPADQGIAGRVCTTGKPVIENDVAHSKHHFKKADQKTSFQTRKLICVPLTVQKKRIGVLQALNKIGDSDYTKEDLRLFEAFALQVAVAIENARLYNLAVYDGLTQVFVRRYFEGWLSQEYARVKRYHREFSLLMFDIDHFKKVNDTYGHQAGDYVLREVSRLAKAAVRESDTMARYGGEEFIIGLPETNLEAARKQAERIRKAIEKHKFVFEGKEIPVTISIGLTNYVTKPQTESARFIKDADMALYRSKENGRNRVTLSTTLSAEDSVH